MMSKNETIRTMIIPLKICNHLISKSILDSIVFCYSINKYYKNIISLPFILEKEIDVVGCKFIVKLIQTNILIFYEIKEVISTDYFSRLKIHAYKTIPRTFKYDYVLDIFNKGDGESLMISSFIYDNNIHISDYKIHEDMLNRALLFQNIEKYVINQEYMKYFQTVINININLTLLWDILLNLKIIHKYAKILCKEINYEGSLIKKGSKVELKYKNCILVGDVIKCDKYKNKGIIRFLIDEEKDNDINMPLNSINIIVYEYELKITLYIYFLFSKNQYLNILFPLRKYYQKELETFKKITEHYYNKKNDIK